MNDATSEDVNTSSAQNAPREISLKSASIKSETDPNTELPNRGSRQSSLRSRNSLQRSSPQPEGSSSPPIALEPKQGTPREPSIASQNISSIKSDHAKNAEELSANQLQTSVQLDKLSQDRSAKKESIAGTKSPKKGQSVDSTKTSQNKSSSSRNMNVIDQQVEESKDAFANLEPQGKRISDHIEELSQTVRKLSNNIKDSQSPLLGNNIDKIATMSKILTSEANALRDSIKHLSQDIANTEERLNKRMLGEDVDFPYHLFLLEIIINKIQMKCECFDMDYNNLVISASFLGKQPIILYDCTYGKIEDLYKLNVGKSIMFAMTYEKICSLREFEIGIELTKQPPCSHCVTKLAETHMNFTNDFMGLKEDLCKKWSEEKPNDNILCTTSTPLLKNQFYLTCGEDSSREQIGVIEVTVRMSFLGKEITTQFCAKPKPKGTSFMLKKDNGMTMYSCQKVEMDDEGKILLDEDVLTTKHEQYHKHKYPVRNDSPISQFSSLSKQMYSRPCMEPNMDLQDAMGRYDEILTKMNDNELKIRVPKSTKVDRLGKYDRIQELCDCEDTPYNTGDQIQFELPRDVQRNYDNTYTSNFKYSINQPGKGTENKDRRLINVTPTNCQLPVNMEKMLHPQKDVFILKIGKKLETKDKKTDLEIELVTPKVQNALAPVDNTNIAQQCSSSEIKKKTLKKGKDKKSKASAKKSKTKAGKSKSKSKK